LLNDLIGLGLWNDDMKEKIMQRNGSIIDIQEIPQHIRDLYKTTYEISQKVIIDMSADRGAFICQSQSLNLFVENPNFSKLSSMHFYAWQKGLKTGMYYLRSKAAVDPIKFTLSEKYQTKFSGTATEVAEEQEIMMANAASEAIEDMQEGKACSLDDPNCLMCGS